MPASATLLQIRQYVAKEMGGMGQGGFLSSTATGGSSTTLVDTAWPVNTTLSVQDQWQDAWILRPAAALASDKVRIVSTYTPNGGTFTVDTAYTNAPTNGEAYEIHTVIEPLTAMKDIINEGLKRCMIETDLTLTPVSLAQMHSLGGVASWMEDVSWVRSVGYLSQNTNRYQYDPYTRLVRGEAREWDGAIWIVHNGRSFLTTDTLFVKAMKPAYNDAQAPSVSFGTATAVAINATSGTWTVTVPSTTNMAAGQVATLSGFVPTIYNGTFPVASVPNGTTFTLANLNPSPGTITTFGTVSTVTFQSGLSLDTDIAPVNLEWAGWAAIVEGWRRYGQILETGAKQRMIPTRDEAARMFTDKNKDNCRWPLLTFKPLMFGGPVHTNGLRPAYKATTARWLSDMLPSIASDYETNKRLRNSKRRSKIDLFLP